MCEHFVSLFSLSSSYIWPKKQKQTLVRHVVGSFVKIIVDFYAQCVESVSWLEKYFCYQTDILVLCV